MTTPPLAEGRLLAYWPDDTRLEPSTVDELLVNPGMSIESWALLRFGHLTHDLVRDVLAHTLVVAAHDIEDPRRRNGPWRPEWRPFG